MPPRPRVDPLAPTIPVHHDWPYARTRPHTVHYLAWDDRTAREAVVVLMSTPSSAICAFWSGVVVRGNRPSRMFRYLIVTRFELITLITSPLLPVGMLNGGS